MPAPGDIYKYYNIDTTNAWSKVNDTSGVWDFNSNTDIGFWSFFSYLQPNQTPYDTSFINDNLVSTSDFYSYNFYNSSNDSLVNIGYIDTTRSIKYVDGFKIFTFPYGLNSAFTDTSFSGYYYSSGFYQTFNSKTTNFCNRVGTLLLNGLTFSNVILVRSSQKILYTYYSNGVPTYFTTQLGEQYSWFDGNTKFPLLDYYYLRSNNSWQTFWTESVSYFRRRKDLITNIQDSEIWNNSLFVDSQNMLHNSESKKITVTDLAGKEIFITHTTQIDLSNLGKGIYLITSSDGNSLSKTGKVFIQ